MRDNVVLGIFGLVLGLLGAAGYGAFRAVNNDGASTAGRFATLGEAMLFPGMLIVAGIAAMVWLGWKANIDG
jgi:hypothetical protein